MIAHSRQPLWGGSVSASTAPIDTFTLYGSADWGDNYAAMIIPAAGFINNFGVHLNGVEGTGTRTYRIWKGFVSSSTGAIIWAASDIAVTIANGAFVGTNPTIKVYFNAGDFLQIRVTGSGSLNSRHVSFGIVFHPTIDGQNILTGVTGTTQLSTATENFPMAGANDIHTIGQSKMYFPTAGVVRGLFIHIPTSPHTGFTFPARSRTFTVYKNNIATTITVTLSSTIRSGSDLSHSFSVVDGDYISLKCLTTNNPRSSYLSAGVVFEPTNKDEFINQYCPNRYMPESNVEHFACNMGGRKSLIYTGLNDYFRGFFTASWTMTYSRHHRLKTLSESKGRKYLITESGTHLNAITSFSPLDITDSSPVSGRDGYSSSLSFSRQVISAFNVPGSFKNTISSASLWHWVDTGSDEVNFF